MERKFLKVLFGNKSFAGIGFEYKIGEVNISEIWKPSANNAKDMGGFSFSTENKILRWLIRGDTLYDVILPDDAEVIEVQSESTPGGVFRTNKIILVNPRKVTDDLSMEIYNKSDLPEKSYFKAMAGVAIRGNLNTALKILEDKVNNSNVDLAISEFEDFCKSKNEKFDKEKLDKNSLKIYNLLKEKQSHK